ncbi:MAG: mechanosensitive ion channel family protein [Planctomycetes bacterium]|nr:mechanosensitive ion channel family protein [Planctomycetota bacterium]
MRKLLEETFGTYAIYVEPIIYFVLVVFAAYVVSPIVGKSLRRLGEKTSLKYDDVIYGVISKFLKLWVILGGCYFIVVNQLEFVANERQIQIQGLIKIIFTLSLVFAASHASALFFSLLGEKSVAFKTVEAPVRFVIRIFLIVIGILLVLHSLHVEITPILGALGIGGLAGALALQDTLANFFAGLHLAADRPIRVGDFIRVGEHEGFVEEVGWRSTRIKTIQNTLVVIPNSLVSQSSIINYSLPEPTTALVIPVGVSYSSDSRKVESILHDVLAKAINELPELESTLPPKVRFTGFGDSSLNFLAICFIKNFAKRGRITTELCHRIFERFGKEGIEIPFPIRTVYMKNINA